MITLFKIKNGNITKEDHPKNQPHYSLEPILMTHPTTGKLLDLMDTQWNWVSLSVRRLVFEFMRKVIGGGNSEKAKKIMGRYS